MSTVETDGIKSSAESLAASRATRPVTHEHGRVAPCDDSSTPAVQTVEQGPATEAATSAPAPPPASTHVVRLASELEVPPEGRPDARLWVIGEAPGETEVKCRRPFVGQAGKVLDGILAEAGVARSACLIDNMVRFRPRGNDFGEFYDGGVPGELLARSRAELLARIATHQPHVVLALGWEPLRLLSAMMPEGGITLWRGSVVERVGGGKLIGTFHPSGLLRQWANRPLAVADVRKALRESQTPDLVRRPRKSTLNWGFGALCDALRDMAEHSTCCAFDIETNTGREITSIALADSPEFAIVVPISFRGKRHWSEREEHALRGLVQAVLESPRVAKIAQNAQYDMIWLKDRWGIDVRPLVMDTMVAHNLLMPEYEKSLAFQCSIYTDVPYYKYERKSTDADTYFRYNAMDAMATFECAQEIQAQLEADGLWEFYQRLPHRLLEPLRELSLRGLRIDLELRKQMIEANRKEREELNAAIRGDASIVRFEEEVLRGKVRAMWTRKWEASKILKKRHATAEAYVGTKELPSFNPDSPEQLKRYLYEFRGFEPVYARRADGGRTLTANAAALKRINTKSPEPLLQAFLDFADLAKENEFLQAKLEPDGRMHCTYDITGTETGRISSKKYVYDTGANLQNQPAGKKKESLLRRIFVPDAGKVFMQRDLKQAEAWVVAFLSEDPFFMDAIRSTDIHRRTASLIFRKPECDITKRERDLAKRCVHALNYGMGYVKFAEQLGISIVEARDLRNRYFAAFPRLQLWHNEVKLKLQRDRELVTPFGRRRQFTAGWNEDLWKAAWAYVPQSTVGDLLNTGFIEFWEWLKAPAAGKEFGAQNKVPGLGNYCSNERLFDTQIMLQIHDSLVVQCPEEHVPVIAEKLRACLERPLRINGHTFTIPTDCSVGPTWLDLKERTDL